MTQFKNFMRTLGIISLMSIALDVYAQPTNTPQIPREAQEVISSAAETIRQDKITIESRSQRIKMMRDQIEAAQKALDLSIENAKLCTEVRKNQEAEIEFLTDQLLLMTKERNAERRKKIFWKCATIVTSVTALYFVFV